MRKRAKIWTAIVLAGVVSILVAQNSSLATCTGADPCKACSSCRYCKHCAKEGGSCGICKRRVHSTTNLPQTIDR
jgi:hypothetical protein